VPLTPTEPAHRVGIANPLRAPVTANLLGLAERQVLDRYAPAFVVINAEGEVLQSSGGTGRYLELPAGAPDTNIFSLARPGLRIELRAAMHSAMRSGQAAVQSDLSLLINGG